MTINFLAVTNIVNYYGAVGKVHLINDSVIAGSAAPGARGSG
jgi:hypothetical protein